jgi:GDP-mannose 6-dehydrogenase
VAAIEHWVGKGKDVRIYDPHVRLDLIYGSNRNFILNALPHIGRLLFSDLGELLRWCDCIVVAQKPSPQAAHQIASAGKPILNLAAAPLSREADPVS